jgi:hypothetical protein
LCVFVCVFIILLLTFSEHRVQVVVIFWHASLTYGSNLFGTGCTRNSRVEMEPFFGNLICGFWLI